MDTLLTRRAPTASLPLAALASTSAVAMPRPAFQHPDEELLRLVDLLHVNEARREELDRVVDEAFDRIEYPDIPDALIWRKSDFGGICMDPRSRCARYRVGDMWQYVYEDRDAIASWWTDPNPGNPHAFCERDRPRANEILRALVEWEAGNKRAEDEAGYTNAAEEADRQAEKCKALRRQIIFTRACSPDGMMAKVRTVALLFPKDTAWVEQQLQEAVARGDGADISTCFGMSLALDAQQVASGA